jgi:hypothetical protein
LKNVYGKLGKKLGKIPNFCSGIHEEIDTYKNECTQMGALKMQDEQ